MTSAQHDMRPASAEAQREGARDLVVLAASALLAGVLMYVLFHGKLTRFEDIGLGKNTAAVFATVDGSPIHCHDLSDADACIDGAHKRGATRSALWLGNSQLHGVNQYQPGQETGSARLFAHLATHGVDLVTLSQPNANLQEHLVLYAYARTRLPLRYLLLPAVFDDVRETGIRTTIVPALEDPATKAVLETSAAGRAILANTKATANADFAALDQTLQERTEVALDGWLKDHVELWSLRPEVRGRLGNWLNEVRNFAFRIDSRTTRHVIQGRYLENMAAAEAILADAQQQGVHVILYVAPLRGETELPYDAAEYAHFRDQLIELAKRYGAEYLNLQDIVPASLYGMTDADQFGVDAEIDFMHFQAAGHAILADHLAAVLDQDEARAHP